MATVGCKLIDIIPVVAGAEWAGDLETTITGMSMDSRRVQPGDLYACVPGTGFDGHDFASQALAAGAKALLVERFLPKEVPQIKVAQIRSVLGTVAAAVYGHPSRQLEVVGVTGTNGKTTVTHLIEKIGAFHGRKVGLIGTLGARIDGREIPGQRTTPEAVELQGLLAEMVAAGVSLAVMEVSSHALDLGRVSGCEYDAGIFTNLTQDHLDYHKSMEEYLLAKARLFRELKGEKQNKLAVLNRDDGSFATLAAASAAPVASYGFQASATYRAEAVKVQPAGVNFAVVWPNGRQAVHYATPGVFSVYNALAAFAWAVEHGYDPVRVAQALGEIPGVPGRFESIRCGQPFQVIVDYAHTPDGLENVLRTAKEFTPRRLITVFGCGGDRDKTKRPLMGEVAARFSDQVIVTSDNPRSEDPERIIEDILAGINGMDYRTITGRQQAIEAAVRTAGPGDTVMIAGKGHETYQIIGAAVLPFDDREVTREALRGLGYA